MSPKTIRRDFDTIIHGGILAAPEGLLRADIGIAGGKIAAIEKGLARRAGAGKVIEVGGAKVIDARGRIVLPGLIDAHVHLDLPCGDFSTADDYDSGTRAAARGGVTTVLDFATPGPGESLAQALDAWFARARPKAIVDYSFHLALTDWPRHREEIPRLVEQGFPTYKAYMTYKSRGLYSDDRAIYGALEMLGAIGGMLMVHAESNDILEELTARLHTPAEMKRLGARAHPLSRPNFIEEEAVQRAITFCEALRSRLYIVHLSTREGLGAVRAAQDRGAGIFAETCPQYLTLNDEVFARPDGHLYACSPPVRSAADQRALWRGLEDGAISVAATDACSFTPAQKARWDGDFTRIPNGLPGLETLLPILWTYGVRNKRFSISRLAEIASANPARLMGLWPRKGVLRPGADADIVILDPKYRQVVDPAALESRAQWSPWAGRNLAGFPETVLSRGEVIVENHALTPEARPGRGQFLPRKKPAAGKNGQRAAGHRRG